MLQPLDIQIMRQAGRKPRVHPNGFIQLDLTDDGYTRLHVWPETPLVAQRSHFSHPVHDHIFDMVSRVICGNLDSIEYEFQERADGDHQLFQARHAFSHEDSTLIQTHRRGNLVAVAVSSHTPVYHPQYRLSAFRFHQAIARGLTATVMFSENPRHRRPLVVVPLGVAVDNLYNRLSYDQDKLWTIIEQAISKSSFVLERVA